MRWIRLLLPLAAATVLAAGCGSSSSAGGRVSVVATTTQAADLARNVGGDLVAVRGLLAANADPHEYEVRPHDVRALADAQLVVRSGGDVDAWLDEAIDASGTDAPVLTLGPGGPDPHWWQDPRQAERAVGEIRD